jgi:hypothetical protein
MTINHRGRDGGYNSAMPSPRRDTVRLLARGTGYTDRPGRALRSGPHVEPEAVPADVQAAYSRAAHRDQAQQRTVQRVRRADDPIARRIAFAQAQARHVGVDVHNAMRLLKLTVAAGRSEAAVLRRVEALERLVFPDLPG